MNFSAKQNRPVVLITGATSGIGYATAKLLTGKGDRVVVHGRDEKTARAACAEINAARALIPVWADLADLAQVRALAKQIKQAAPPLDAVIFNAGVFQKGGLLSVDGFELDFAVNYLSHLLLAHLLLEHLAPQARVIFVSSSAYINGKADASDLGKQYLNDPMTAYATSKQLCLMAALEMARRLSRTGICVNTCNPGPTNTGLLATGKEYGWRNAGNPPIKAARRLEWLALSPELRSVTGRYFNGKQTPNVPKRVRDEKTTAAIYEASIRLCKAQRSKLNLGTDLNQYLNNDFNKD